MGWGWGSRRQEARGRKQEVGRRKWEVGLGLALLELCSCERRWWYRVTAWLVQVGGFEFFLWV
jgi:hypothetical protein